jgi:hypothetical protein
MATKDSPLTVVCYNAEPGDYDPAFLAAWADAGYLGPADYVRIMPRISKVVPRRETTAQRQVRMGIHLV